VSKRSQELIVVSILAESCIAGSGAAEATANEACVDAQFRKMKSRSVDAGMPALLGECGAIPRTEYDPAGTCRTYRAKYVTKSACRHGIVQAWWNPGYGCVHASGPFDRSTGDQYFPDLVEAVVDSTRHAAGGQRTQ
jgi:endoglucanase